jgi:tetratricopeptide (TPR) repeat protein
MAECSLLGNDMEKAESHLQKALQQDPVAPIVRAARARLLPATGRFDEARALLSEDGPHEDLPTWRLCRIDLLRRDGQAAEASRAMEELINDFPEAPRLRVWRIESLLDAGRREEALRHDPNSAAALHLLGMVRYRQDDYPRALEHLKKASKLAPQSGRFRYQYGRALAAAGHKERAAEQIQKAVHLMANPYRAYTTLGMIHHERNEIDEAMECYERAIAANPDKAAEAYNNLAHIYLKQQNDPTPAVAFAHTAQAVSPPETRGKMYDTLVSSLLRSGHGALAVRPARMAARLGPDDPGRQLRLGVVEAAAGNRKGAIQALKRVPVLTDESRLREEAAKLLTALRDQTDEDR